jgi:predicted Zn-dependent protease
LSILIDQPIAAQVLLELDRHEKALGAANRAVELAPDWAVAHVTLARTYLAGQQLQRALHSFEQALVCAFPSWISTQQCHE